jgi:hypothetical protein
MQAKIGTALMSFLHIIANQKFVRKFATKALEVVGALIFAYDFSDCMGWIH